MSDWAAGDLAVCVDAVCAPMLIRGAVYTVTGIDPGPGIDRAGRIQAFGLWFAECQPSPGCNSFGENRFRKIDKHEACETEFVTLLKRSKRRVVA